MLENPYIYEDLQHYERSLQIGATIDERGLFVQTVQNFYTLHSIHKL